MSWIEVTVNAEHPALGQAIGDGRTWCAQNLSSNGVLWKHEWTGDDLKWRTFKFAQPQDAMLFRLTMGI
jgi:hypothetical protein